ncbi:MAG: glycosyltransferase family 2 protein [Acidobacteriota bacterium]
MRLSVILSTYNQPEWLEKALIGYAHQTWRDFEVVIADDGSTDETRERIDKVRAETGLQLQHVWHEDDGFRKTIILNKATLAAEGDYLVFSDGDCIPRRDFLAVHAERAEPGHFLSGGYFKLPLDVSEEITAENIADGDHADPAWLKARGVRSRMLKLSARGVMARFLDVVTPTKATWNGHNASGWKADLLEVNGFDERMVYGGEDRELGERLMNAGRRAKQIRHHAVCVHLDHGRPWRTNEAMAGNAAIREVTRKERRTWTEFGIERREQAVGAEAS